ncbi:excinuclease ABC subunit C [Anabaena sp. UHCC 0253]|uniref:GIY-YIG nuclease family protein n=1 Tax=Anabaena sp. UHCC 0253 TaxID=2590019 RepID=UPI001444A1AA|nr:excinuclease ABC subunit C [Anabaena sp. UHCC 0253]MTJ53323.1 excinuclease ABC subunit C [Anabaena sp. UHCC 0253]
MNKDEFISKLPNLPLKSREQLPEKSGIYYVIDDQSIIWYIGLAKNLRSRWAGKSHHRIYQLEKQRKKVFTIYYEFVHETQLDVIEQQRIEQYNPQLNGTIVKTKKLRPTETLLRETLVVIAPYSFILGVEPPRKDDLNFMAKCQSFSSDRRIQKSVLPLSVIHICINLEEVKIDKLKVLFTFLRNVFKKRINYTSNWILNPANKQYEKYGTFLTRRLLVNGFAIEVSMIHREVLKKIQSYDCYDLMQIAGIDIRVMNENTLNILKDTCKLNDAGICLYSDRDNSEYEIVCNQALKRLNPYKIDLVKLLFNEEINQKKFQTLPIESKPKLENNNNLSSRLVNLAAKKIYLQNLLTERGIDINSYQVNKYLERIPTDNNYVDNNSDRTMTIYVKPFLYGDLRKPGHYSQIIYGNKGLINQKNSLDHFPYEAVYLNVKVDKVLWLLLEEYLSDFIKVELNPDEGYIEKYYVSARTTLKPSKISVTLNGKWKTDIPFGTKDNMSYAEVVNIITERLNSSGISKLKFSFSMI